MRNTKNDWLGIYKINYKHLGCKIRKKEKKNKTAALKLQNEYTDQCCKNSAQIFIFENKIKYSDYHTHNKTFIEATSSLNLC